MINDLISNIILAFDDLLTKIGINNMITTLLSYLDDFQSYTTEFNKYLSGVYFIFGKSLVIYIVSVAVVIIILRIALAVVNLVGQFVP